jgi:hypothetical protein
MPWNNPDPEKVAEWAGWFDGEQPTALSGYLSRLLFMNDYIVTDPYDEDKLLFCMVDDKGEKVEFDRNARRLRLTASCGYRFAKSWECPDHRITQELVIQEEATWSRDEDGNYFCEIEERDADYQENAWTAGEEDVPIRGVPFDLDHWKTKRNYGVKFIPKINLRWAIRRRDRSDFRPEKVPGYKLHESAASIIAITGCSRATAFRWIEKFMAEPPPEPEPYKVTTAKELLPLIVQAGGGYMRLTPGAVYVGSAGYYSAGVRMSGVYSGCVRPSGCPNVGVVETGEDG